MHTLAAQQFVRRRVPVRLRVPGTNTSVTCSTHAIGRDSLLLQGGPTLGSGRVVELAFTRKDGEQVSVEAVVEPHETDRLCVRYRELDPHRRERLLQTLWPDWDGHDLLDGLILMAGRFGVQTLADLIRLTSLLCAIQNKRCKRPARTVPLNH